MTKTKANEAVASSTNSSVATIQDWWYKPPTSPASIIAHAVLRALWSGRQIQVGCIKIQATVTTREKAKPRKTRTKK